VTAYTIGHSSRSAADFIALLEENDIRGLVDVRRFPGSRQHPHFNRETLAATLAAAGIAYRHAPELGGRRRMEPDSPNTAWRNSGFRGYADWMSSAEFAAALATLLDDIAARPTVYMCAEAVPWSCHRFLLSDAIVARGIDVLHIMGPGSLRPHALNENARIAEDGTVTYPSDDPQIGLL
jgi:uncharacterized protein (DUF488 family)